MRRWIRRIWRLIEGERGRYGAAIGALVLASLLSYIVPLVPQLVIDGVLVRREDRAQPFVEKLIGLAGGPEVVRAHLFVALVLVVCLTAGAGAFTYLRGRWSATAAERIARRVRERLYDQLQHLPLGFHDGAMTGDLVQRCTSDVETLRLFLSTQVVEIGRAVLMMAVPIPLMLALDARLTLVSVAIVPPIFIYSLIFFRRVRLTFQLVDEAEGALTATIQENLTGIRVVRAFGRQSYEKEKLAARNRAHRDLDYRLYRHMAWYWSLSDLLCMGQKALLVGVGGYWLATGALTVGTFYFFLAAVNMFIWPMRMLGRVLTDLGKATVAITRIEEILDHPRESSPRTHRGPDRRVPSEGVGDVRFEGVTFAHGDEPVLDGVSFRIAPGETLAIVGSSGSGKSTIVNLLLRFYDPDRGRVLLDGVDIAELGRKDVREAIAVVMQEPFLYSKTLRENIRLGHSLAMEEEIAEAARSACVHEAISGFEEGYDTVVGERGVTLSGGQRQRVALARALLTEPAVLILDDALSAVDTDTEAMIVRAVRRRAKRLTTILIAHRLSTLAHADRVLVLEAGHVAEVGAPSELLEVDGFFRRLWEIQSAVEVESAGDVARGGG